MAATLHVADVLCTLAAPPLAAGGVLVEDGRIVAAGSGEELAGAAQRRVVHSGVLLPGFVAARTQVEHADARRLAVDAADWDDERWSRSAHRGAHELLRAGVAVACDVVERGAGVPALARAGVAGDSLVAVHDVGDADADDVLGAVARSLALPARGRRVGVAVDAGRVGERVLAGAVALAAGAGAPLHVDAAGAPLECLERAGALTAGTRLAGVGPVGRAAAAELAARGVVVVLGADEGVTLPELAAAGVAVVLAGDGAEPADTAGAGAAGGGGASGLPAPDPLAAAAAWRTRAARAGLTAWPTPEGSRPLAEAALRLVTVDGAARLGHGGRGVLRAGAPADFCVVDVAADPDADPAAVSARLLAEGPGRQVLTVVGGVRRARRTSAAEPWPALSDHRYEET